MSFGKMFSSAGKGNGPRLLMAAAVLAAFGIGFLIRGGGGGGEAVPAADTQDHQAEATIWTCSMHPQIKLPKPGKCPICFMDLIPLDNGSGDDDLGPRSLVLSEAATALAEIQTAIVVEKAVESRIRLIGEVAYDETRLRTISAWVPGRIDTLFVDFTGTVVAKGDRLVSLYSPELYAAQAELLNAVQAGRELRNSPDELMRRTAENTVASARERLKLWGLTPAQIDRIANEDQARDHLDITSPLGGVVVHKKAMEGMYVKTGSQLYTVADLSRVWVTLRAYEMDLVWLSEGQTVNFTVEALPGQVFSGTIIFVDPVLDKRTRTVEVRIDVDNAAGLLKPGMFVSAVAEAGVNGNESGTLPVVIPATAPLITGERAVVYVREPDTEKPTFTGRVVVLGPRVGDSYIVKSGLLAGEVVVTRGNFKIDSALQIQARPSMMNPDGGGPTPGHNHGGQAPRAGDEPATAAAHSGHEAPLEAPAAFSEQLGTVLEAYLASQAALAEDDDGGAAQAAVQANEALAAVDMGLLAGDAHMAWMKDLPGLQNALGALAAAPDLEARRTALRPATDTLWPVLERFGYTRDETVRLFHCPMANDSAGANWIQLPETTANPYFGTAMSRCGSQIDSLTTSPAGEGR